MNGPHDLGGRDGFGPIQPEKDEPVFHAPWEARALAVTLAAGAMGHWSIDESRSARESLHPAEYYKASYYEIWIKALEKLLLRHGFVTEQELAAGHSLGQTAMPKRVLKAEEVASTLAKGGPADRDPGGSMPLYKAGDAVRTRNFHPRHHCRLPGYARDKIGRVEAVQGYHVFPDASAQGDTATAHWLYTVTFEARTLWGDRAGPDDLISIDAWEPYLERV